MSTESLLAMFVAVSILAVLQTAHGHGYLTGPRSRNLLAFQETVWWPQRESDPEPEMCPHCLNRGGTLAQCGIAQEMRNYDVPLNALGGPMQINQQATYLQGQDITIDVTLTAHHKGHFEFAACAISPGEKPTKECFEQNKLTFVEDLMYGASFDPNYPHRAYIAPVNVAVPGEYVPNYGTTKGLMDFKYKMRLPENVYGDLVLIQWYYLTANSCIHEGYAEYNWPEGWREDSMSASMCGEVSPDGEGAPEQFWNCAETRVLANNVQAATTSNPTNPPTSSPTVSVQMSSLAIPVSSMDTSNLASTPKLTSGSSHGKTIVGYYASWQWYDRNKLAAPENMDFTKLQRVNYAFFQTDVNGNLWGTDSWGDPNVLFGPYDWNPGPSSKQFCSWDSPTDRPCNYHMYEQGLIHLVHAAGAELYPSLGGWTLSDPFPAMAANPTARANFAQNCVELIQAYDFDGIDIDWEYPGFVDHSGTPNDRENFRLLLDEVRAKLDDLGAQTGRFYGLTAALPCGPSHIANMDISHVASTLSELNLMTYDFHGAFSPVTGTNAPLYPQGWGEVGFSLHECVENWLAGGGTKEKLNIGLPFYGRSFAGATGLNEPHDGADQVVWGIDDGTPQYFNIMEQLPSMTHVWDKTTWTDWAYFESGGAVSFDSVDAICAKTEYAIVNDLNGFIIWELSGTLMSDLSTPLLDVVNKKLTDPSYSCGERGYYPDETIAANPSPSVGISEGSAPVLSSPNQSPIIDYMPTINNPVPSYDNGAPTPSSIGNLPVMTNPNDPTSAAIYLNCNGSQDTNPKPIDLSFKYEMHRHPLVSAASAMQDIKMSMLDDIGKNFGCEDATSGSIGRGLFSIRRKISTTQEQIVAIMSPPSDSRNESSPCSVDVNIGFASVCDSMIGSLTIFVDGDTSASAAEKVWEQIIYSIRIGMAAGKYESQMVLKAIFIDDLTGNQLSSSMAAWNSNSDGLSGSTIAAIVVCILIIIATLTMQLLFFNRAKAPTPNEYKNEDAEEDSIASSISAVEDVWKKALDTYDAKGALDPVGDYVVTTKSTNSSYNSDGSHEVELATKVEHDKHLLAFDKASKGTEPPEFSDDGASDDQASDEKDVNNVDRNDPPDDKDQLSTASSEWSDLSAMEIFELKTELEIYGVNCSGMIEREEFVNAVKDARARKSMVESGVLK